MRQLGTILLIGIPAGLFFAISGWKTRFQIVGLVVFGWLLSFWLRHDD